MRAVPGLVQAGGGDGEGRGGGWSQCLNTELEVVDDVDVISLPEMSANSSG